LCLLIRLYISIIKASLIKWTYEALCVNEFTGLKFIPKENAGSLASTEGIQVLESLGFKDSTINRALQGLGKIIIFNYAFTYVSLLLQKPSSEPLKPFTKSSTDDIQNQIRQNITNITVSVSADKDKDKDKDKDELSSFFHMKASKTKRKIPMNYSFRIFNYKF